MNGIRIELGTKLSYNGGYFAFRERAIWKSDMFRYEEKFVWKYQLPSRGD